MKRILLTGMSGVGKSSLIEELSARGYKAVDTDYDGYSHLVNVPEDEMTGHEPGEDWVWREDRIQELLDAEDADVLFVSGASPNQGQFYSRFDHIVLLSAPAGVMAQRLTSRTNNPYGQRPEDVERALLLKDEIEPLLRRGATHEIDTSAPLDQVVAEVLELVDENT